MIANQLLLFANHLWQSTLFAAVAGLITLLLRENRAHVRYWLWLSASVKFLIPFSILVGAGGLLGRHTSAAIAPSTLVSATDISSAIGQVAEPFTMQAAQLAMPAVHWSYTSAIVAVLIAVWAVGFATLVCRWAVHWRRMRASVRTASPLDLPIGLPVKSSPAFGEPGVFGILRPALLLPDGIADCLTGCEMDAIVAHELCHIRRRDNLVTAVHMAVEALFWFHPLVWWVGARLMEERERACDEEVLRTGGDPRAYAEGILKICELYLASPLACVAGVTGGDLKRRIEAIISNRPTLSLNYAKKAVLTVAAMAAVVAPVAVGIIRTPLVLAQSQSTAVAAGQSVDTRDWQAVAGGKMAFEVASVKMDQGPFRPPNFGLDTGDDFTPGNRFSADFPLLAYIQFAYKVNFGQQQREFVLAHWPKWINSDRYAIEAKAAGPVNKDQMRLMMQTLLSDRFGLAVHFETQETAVMALKLVRPGKTGPKLLAHSEGPACEDQTAAATQSRAGDSSGPFPARCYVQELYTRGHQLRAGSRNTTMEELAGVLSNLGRMGRPFVDQTGLSGRIDYEMEWIQEPNPAGAPDANPPSDQGPTFLEALREQLGLRLEPTKALLRVLVIDRIERPSEN